MSLVLAAAGFDAADAAFATLLVLLGAVCFLAGVVTERSRPRRERFATDATGTWSATSLPVVRPDDPSRKPTEPFLRRDPEDPADWWKDDAP